MHFRQELDAPSSPEPESVPPGVLRTIDTIRNDGPDGAMPRRLVSVLSVALSEEQWDTVPLDISEAMEFGTSLLGALVVISI